MRLFRPNPPGKRGLRAMAALRLLDDGQGIDSSPRLALARKTLLPDPSGFFSTLLETNSLRRLPCAASPCISVPRSASTR